MADMRVTQALAKFAAGSPKIPLVAELSNASKLSSSRFAHLFKTETGMPVHGYGRMQQINRAIDLLRGTTLQIKEIAAQVGFRSPKTFATAFRLKVGKTPTQVRKQQKREPH